MPFPKDLCQSVPGGGGLLHLCDHKETSCSSTADGKMGCGGGGRGGGPDAKVVLRSQLLLQIAQGVHQIGRNNDLHCGYFTSHRLTVRNVFEGNIMTKLLLDFFGIPGFTEVLRTRSAPEARLD